MIDLHWYSTLAKPPLTPPSWIFAPAWTLLYITILASIVIYATTKTEENKGTGYVLFVMQMIFNLIWTPVFFILHDLILSSIIIVILDILVIFNIKEFYKVSKFSALLLVPYLIWILFATYLNLGILVLKFT